MREPAGSRSAGLLSRAPAESAPPHGPGRARPARGGIVLTQWHGTAGTVTGLAIAITGVVPVFVAATTSALGYVSHEEAGLASGVVNTFHEVGGSIGVAIVSTIAATGIEA